MGHQAYSQQIRLVDHPYSNHFGTVEVDYQEILDSLDLTPSVEASLKVFTGPKPTSQQPALLGTVAQGEHRWYFKPRFPFELDQWYRAELTLGQISIIHRFRPQSSLIIAAPKVVSVFPNDTLLPSNVLRFYIDFSQPMTQHRAYDYIHMLNQKGDTVSHLFYPADPPLWDPSGKKLTVLLDPGRIKTGLQPNLEWGLGLQSNHQYHLVISGIKDYRGNKLAETFSFSFTTTDADHSSPNYRQWHVEVPAAASTEPLVINFDEAINIAQLPDQIRIVKDGVDWPITLKTFALRVALQSKAPWTSGDYELMVFNTLEDRAGNSLRKPFEVSDGRSIAKPQWISIPFQVKNEKP